MSFIIIASKKGKYFKQIDKLINESLIEAKSYYIEDLLISDIKFNSDDLLYFMCSNYSLIKSYLLTRIIDAEIINKTFLLKEKTKKDVQLILSEKSINTPKLLNDINDKFFYLKENNHEGLSKKIKGEELNDFSHIDYYLEEYIDYKIELKLYYVYGQIFNKKEIEHNIKLINICNNISRILSLDVFSVDILIDDLNYYVIDVNYSPGFYLSDIGRKSLLISARDIIKMKVINIRTEKYNEALAFATKKHEGQLRIGGLPYITHPIAVSDMLRDKGYDEEYQITGLFHDLLEDTDATEEEILNIGGIKVLEAVKLLTKTKGYVMEEYISNIKGNPIAFAVKTCDRLHNLMSAKVANDKFKKRYILESKKWYIDFSSDIENAIKELEETLI